MQTRKSLNDREGWRTLYVVEAFYDGWGSVGGVWAILHDDEESSIHSDRQEAVLVKEIVYKKLKAGNYKWSRRRFRIAVYVRAE